MTVEWNAETTSDAEESAMSAAALIRSSVTAIAVLVLLAVCLYVLDVYVHMV